jgi:hypothetical protein
LWGNSGESVIERLIQVKESGLKGRMSLDCLVVDEGSVKDSAHETSRQDNTQLDK